MKLCNNFLSAAAMTATSEAMVMGVKAGLDPRIMLDVINSGSGRNTATEDKFGRVVLPRLFNLGFTTGLMTRICGCAWRKRSALGVPMEVARRSSRMLELACDEIGPDKDLTTVVQTVERRAGVEVRAADDANERPRPARGLRHPLRPSRAQAAENFIGGDPHDVLQPLDLLRLGHRRTRRARSLSIPASTRPWDESASARSIKPVREGLARARRRSRAAWRPSSSATCTMTIVGNYELFPRARYHLQDREMAYATGRLMCHTALRMPFEAEDVVAMVRKVFAGRVAFHDGEDEIVPGVTVHHIGGHSKGLQSVRVKTQRGYVVLAADAAHLYAHLESGRIFPLTYNVGEVVEGYETLKKLATSPDHIVPGPRPARAQRAIPRPSRARRLGGASGCAPHA